MVMMPTASRLLRLQTAEIQLLVSLEKPLPEPPLVGQCRCGKMKTAKGHFIEKSYQGQKEKHIAPTESQHPLPKSVE